MDTIAGLPAHPLFVHLAVVAIPLTAVLAILASIWPAARRRLGWFTPVSYTHLTLPTNREV